MPSRINIASFHLLLFVALLAFAPHGYAAVEVFNVTEPRSIGYSVGDTAQRRAHIKLETPWRLDSQQLPTPGTIDSWLELRSVDVRVSRGWSSITYDITFTYQALNAPERVQQIELPEQDIFFTDGQENLSLLMSRHALTLAPLLDARAVKKTGFYKLESNKRPVPINTVLFENRALIAGLVLLITLLGLAYIHFSIPFLKRSNGPFARAYAHLLRLRRQTRPENSFDPALKHVHAAFNETAGRVVFATELDSFFAHNPRYTSCRDAIDRFFNQSRRHFFEDDSGSPAAEALDALLDTCRLCRDIERGLA